MNVDEGKKKRNIIFPAPQDEWLKAEKKKTGLTYTAIVLRAIDYYREHKQ